MVKIIQWATDCKPSSAAQNNHHHDILVAFLMLENIFFLSIVIILDSFWKTFERMDLLKFISISVIVVIIIKLIVINSQPPTVT